MHQDDGPTVTVVDEVDPVLPVREDAAVEGELLFQPRREKGRREELGGQFLRFLTVFCSTSCAAFNALAIV